MPRVFEIGGTRTVNVRHVADAVVGEVRQLMRLARSVCLRILCTRALVEQVRQPTIPFSLPMMRGLSQFNTRLRVVRLSCSAERIT